MNKNKMTRLYIDVMSTGSRGVIHIHKIIVAYVSL